MNRIATIALATIASAWGAGPSMSQHSTAEFVFQDAASNFVARVTLPDPLPFQSFKFVSQDPEYTTNRTFEHVRQGVADCYFSGGMPTICNRSAGTNEPMPDRISNGSRLSEQRHPDVSRYVLDDGSFADFREGVLLRFGIVRQDGSIYFSYDRVSQ